MAAVAAAVVMHLAAPAAQADLAQLKASCQARNAAPAGAPAPMPFRFCDDDVPPVGGTTPNPTARVGR